MNAVRPLILEELSENWRGLRRLHKDIEQSVFLRLWQGRSAKERLTPPLNAEVKRAVEAVAKSLRRDRLAPLKAGYEAHFAPNQEMCAIAKQLMGRIKELPTEARTTLMLHVQHVTTGTPALHEALSLDPESAAQRLRRAQAAATALLLGAEGEVAHA